VRRSQRSNGTEKYDSGGRQCPPLSFFFVGLGGSRVGGLNSGMRILPVLDLKDGVVVRGEAGGRGGTSLPPLPVPYQTRRREHKRQAYAHGVEGDGPRGITLEHPRQQRQRHPFGQALVDRLGSP
jgi:hypothetical protein